MQQHKALALNAIDMWFLGSEPFDLVIVSPGVPDVTRAADCLRAALKHVPQYASRIARFEQDTALVFDPSAPEFQLNPCLGLGWQEVTDRHIGLLAASVESRPGGHTAAMAMTPLQDGYAVCLTASHVVGDARSFVTLLRTWLHTYLGASLPAVSNQRAFKLEAHDLAPIDPRRSERASIGGQEAAKGAKQESLRLSAEVLRQMMSQVGGSLHQAATVLLLRAFSDRLFATQRTVRLRVPVDVRGVLPELSDHYIGNAFLDAFVEITRDDVDGPPSRIADMQREAIARVKGASGASQLLRLGPDGLVPTELWTADQHAFDESRDVVFGSLVGRVAPAGVNVDLGHGPVRFLPRTSAPRGFLVAPDRTEGLMVQVRLQAGKQTESAMSSATAVPA
jgi:hypothetical protein